MIVTTTNSIEGREIKEYIDIVFGEVVEGMDVIKDFGAGIRNLVGGRSKGYEDSLIESRRSAINELKERASGLGADAVVGCKFDYEYLGTGGMIMVTISGTAVKLKEV